MSAEPSVPGQRFPDGYGVNESKRELLPWSWARAQLEDALTFWLVTVRCDGRPHAIPTWGAWVDDRFYCEGSPDTVYGRNIARDPRVVVHLESGDEVVVMEGVARFMEVIPADLSARIEAGYAKYRDTKNYVPDPSIWPAGMWEIAPGAVRGWRRLDEAMRWTFKRDEA